MDNGVNAKDEGELERPSTPPFPSSVVTATMTPLEEIVREESKEDENQNVETGSKKKRAYKKRRVDPVHWDTFNVGSKLDLSTCSHVARENCRKVLWSFHGFWNVKEVSIVDGFWSHVEWNPDERRSSPSSRIFKIIASGKNQQSLDGAYVLCFKWFCV